MGNCITTINAFCLYISIIILFDRQGFVTRGACWVCCCP